VVAVAVSVGGHEGDDELGKMAYSMPEVASKAMEPRPVFYRVLYRKGQ